MKKNNLAEKNPELAKEWHPTLNCDLTPMDVGVRSGRKVWWQCKRYEEHQWDAAICSRSKGVGCPYCRNKKVLPGYNDLSTTNAELAKEWHPNLNGDLTPKDVTAGSNKKAWWQCDKKHEWSTGISERNKGNGCPKCSGRNAIKGETDLSTNNLELANEWHPSLNGDLTPFDVKVSSSKRVWWRCSKHPEHEWEASVSNRSKGTNCPYCAGQKIFIGFNDLATVNPELAKEWHSTLNGDLTPSDMTLGSGMKVWWECKKGHEWKASVGNRNKGRGCSKCSAEMKTSFPEQAIYYYLKQALAIEVTNRASVFGMEVDVFIPAWSIGVEYDGRYFHDSDMSATRENKKNQVLSENGIQLIRIKEDVEIQDDVKNVIYCTPDGQYHYLKPVIHELTAMLTKMKRIPITVNVDVKRDTIEIYEQYIESAKKNSFAVRNPELAAEWHPVLNGRIKPEYVAYSSGKKVWWQCSENANHVWNTPPSTRHSGSGCPYCAGRKALPGYDDLITKNPELAKEWHPTKNGELKPINFTIRSSKQVWWQCDEHHVWQATINHRNRNGRCPQCTAQIKEHHSSKKRAQKVLNTRSNAPQKSNCLVNTNPELVTEWHPTKNGALTPSDVTAGSTKKVWWQCRKHKEHQWETIISNRSKGCGCPYCSGNKVLQGYNDLATTNPKLADEWHPMLNGELTPFDVTAGSNKEICWQCRKHKEHQWNDKVCNRRNGTKCPFCSNLKVLMGYNDLKTTQPELAKEWHPTLNGDLTPFAVTTGSSKKVWWQCDKKHEWEAPVERRSKGSGCPYCSGRYAVTGENDLLTTHPELAREWHPTKNGILSPFDIVAGSGKKAWWQCSIGHEWQAVVAERKKGVGRCPECRKQNKQTKEKR
jgi:hypothetical protein